ncbi:mechanosensitive ion channel family protein [Clostridium oryzae]|uniref:Putative MscS family protein YkuT n=1 Tax=Clostridium oryzae TaxID=1450648 RepID=A0A1V4IFF2_9CLOT|nr:mechanosensitive ion channel family protein [Clostridium oryzae]OPJ58683.1 putative MscS family protein YkuT [Clostridium oryzae]
MKNNEVIKFITKNLTEDNINNVLINLLSIIAIIVCMYISIKVGTIIIKKVARTQNKLRISLDESRTKTLVALLTSILRYTVYFIGIGGIITILFGKIGLTFAGIGGVAVGFGAQSLIKDIVNGFFILLEQQYVVGDYITIGSKDGIVESLELRITKIRDFNGDLHIIPNGLITDVTNHSKGDMRVMVDVEIAYDEDTDSAIKVLEDAVEEFKKSNDDLVEGPDVVGIVSLSGRGVSIRVVGKAKAMTQWQCENELRTFLKKELDRNGIRFPQVTTNYSSVDKGEGK